MQTRECIEHICNWLLDYNKNAKSSGFVVGVSGGIDSAVTSTLAAKTGLPTLCLEMPIHQESNQVNRANEHIEWLKKQFNNVQSLKIDLGDLFNTFVDTVDQSDENSYKLSLANSRARLRMTTLYYYAQLYSYLVVGTGNKVEDFGIGFYTKYGDGGVDLSPIADLFKTEVFEIGKTLGVIESILTANPTDGLWEDNRTDEEQIGATYSELEWAMRFKGDISILNDREKEVIQIYKTFHNANKHKMIPIPICEIPNELK